MKSEKYKLIVAVYLLFRKEDKILLLRRANTGYADGQYGLVAGHLDAGESLRQAAVREAKEESGVDIDEKNLILKTTMHRKKEEDERVGFFYEPTHWSGELRNIELDKCDDLRWFPLNELPENVIPYIRQAIECYKNGIIYSEFGWHE